MLQWIIKKIVGNKNQRTLRKLWPTVREINRLEEALQSQPEEVLREKTAAWKEQLYAIEDPAVLARELEVILPEAFAVVKNAARRLVGGDIRVCDQPLTWDMVHFDVQLIGGIGLHRGMIAEMATGEGKTLVATLPVYLNALTGRGVHVVTVNDYLAKRDSEWMGQIYGMLGLTVGCIQNGQHDPAIRRAHYGCDVTYGTNSEFGFDYLRDNGMAQSKLAQVQRGHYFAIIDEVDSVLVDEARTPLIISGPVTVSNQQYERYKPIVDQLVRKQTTLCNELVAEAKSALEAGDQAAAGRVLFKVKLGQPRNRGLMRMLEEPEIRRLIDKTELSYYQDSQKRELFAAKEELYFTLEEKSHDSDLQEKGRAFLNPEDPDAFVLPDLAAAYSEIDGDDSLDAQQKIQQKTELQRKLDFQAERIHNISQLLKAYCLYERDREYVIEDNKIVIVDEHTGRKMPGRRWSDGLHQAVEAKEGVKIEGETQTLATITIQNYFRLYEKLAGMTGTAETEASEFHDIYRLDVLVIPTNRPVRRSDENDRIYKTEREKFNAVVQCIAEAHGKGQPILLGTASVDTSEKLSRLLKRAHIPHNVLNAKQHRQEAEIVARAGQNGAVTVSTNMAGRGTDIKLGSGVVDLGGLLVLGTERHESRRIDRQLRGRCARQGDPGASVFYLSFEDSLMRNFGASERMTRMMERFGLDEGEELQHPWLNKSVQTAQKRVEARNYQARKRILEFDDVMNQQRTVVYGYRNEILESEDPHELIDEVIRDALPARAAEFLVPDDEGRRDTSGLLHWINGAFPLGLTEEAADLDNKTDEAIKDYLVEQVKKAYTLKSQHENPDHVKSLERHIMLNAVDKLWQEHLFKMDSLREAVFLRSYGQKDPLIEYKNEAYAIFVELMDNIRQDVLQSLFRSTTSIEGFQAFLAKLQRHLRTNESSMTVEGGGATSTASSGAGPGGLDVPGDEDEDLRPKITLPVRRDLPKVGRNEPCPCGSGRKFKQCCGR
ncbi:MAG TPA: preprotein translocase subunit SecA [Verrucomicrobiales bacterium]|nr:preprotein translocase subunit SecA [Verrucomicrobiales bacterium]